MSFALVSRRAGLGLGRRMVRFESTSTTTKAADTAKNAANKASATASEYTAKASEGLSRVTAAAGPAITSAAKGAADALGKVGGRTGRLVAFVERTTPPIYTIMHSFDICCCCCAGRSRRLVERRFANRSTGQVPNVVYYSKVGIELSKLVFKGQNMTPP